MKYIDIDKLRNLGRDEFLAIKPYPYFNTEAVLTRQGYQDLLHNMPPMDLFDTRIGEERVGGQTPHDRYSLEYEPGMPVPQPWQEFIAELRGDAYRSQIQRLLGAKKIEFRMHWHYTPTGMDVSPHCDARREHGSHLFYFNSEEDWDPAWGGATLVLDDGGKLDYKTAPALEEFDAIHEVESIGNYSALMLRTDRAWHAVRPISCPEGRMRKIFILVVNPDNLFWKVRDRIIGKKIQRL
jgi:hypothetical protein